MSAEPGRKPLLRGRGVLRLEEFCHHTGLAEVTVKNLMRSELRVIALWKEDGSPIGLFEDALPSRQDLADMGLPVRDDYEPDALRGHYLADDEDPDG